MSPGTLLQLWRDRWHLPHHPEHSVPLVHGKISRWTMDLARSDHWGIPGLFLSVLAAALFILSLAVTTALSTNSQIVLGWSLVFFAIYLRRHRGQVVALTIVCMAALLALRYFFWRTDATLPWVGMGSVLLGLALLSAEFLVWLRSGLAYYLSVWPIHTASDPLPDDAVGWPTVDIVLLPAPDSVDRLETSLATLSNLDWPRNKYRAVVLTQSSTTALSEACSRHRATLMTYSECNRDDHAALLNRFLYESDAELLVIADSSAAIDTRFLRSTVGWFVHEPRLGLVQTPGFHMAPAPNRTVHAYVHAQGDQPSAAVIRKAAIMEVGGFCAHPTSQSNSTETKLDSAGYFNAYLMTDGAEGKQPQYTRLDGPYKSMSLALRIRLDGLLQGLQFYAPVCLAVFWITPIAVLCFGATPIHTDLVTLAAYWLPAWVLGRLALATALEHHRLRWLDFLKEELGAIAVLVRTSRSFFATLLLQMYGRSKARLAIDHDRLPTRVRVTPRADRWMGALTFGTLTLVGLLGLGTHDAMTLAPLYVAWSLFLALGFLADLAVQRELDWVEAHHSAGQRLPCMLKILDNGKVFRTTTTNFPSTALVAAAPQSAEIATGAAAQVSIFVGAREFMFPCSIAQVHSQQVTLHIAKEAAAEYLSLSKFVFSRPGKWPLWLPPSHADRLLPGWLLRLLLRAQDAFYNLTVKFNITSLLQRFRARIFPGSSSHG